jgi:hypothetical protein
MLKLRIQSMLRHSNAVIPYAYLQYSIYATPCNAIPMLAPINSSALQQNSSKAPTQMHRPENAEQMLARSLRIDKMTW